MHVKWDIGLPLVRLMTHECRFLLGETLLGCTASIAERRDDSTLCLAAGIRTFSIVNAVFYAGNSVSTVTGEDVDKCGRIFSAGTGEGLPETQPGILLYSIFVPLLVVLLVGYHVQNCCGQRRGVLCSITIASCSTGCDSK